MGNKRIDQKMFDAIKIMLEGGATGPEIEKYMKVSSYTVSKIRNAESFTEYKNMLAARALAAKEKYNKTKAEDQKAPADEKQEKPAQVVEHRQNVTIQTTYYVSQKLDKICDLLTALSAKVAFVVEELTK